MATIQAGAPTIRRPLDINLSLWGAYLGAGLAAGFAGGIVARVAMRLVVLIEGGTPNFTLNGTLGILFLFAMPGILVGAICLALVYATAARPRALFLWMAVALLLLLIGPLYLVATDDLPNASAGRIALLMLVFVPVPLVMAGVAVYGGHDLWRRAAAAPKRLPLPWAAATAVMAGAAFGSALGALSGAQRHPRLVNTLLGTAGADFTFMADRLRSIGLLIFFAYMGIALWALWRQPQIPSVRAGVPLALALPALLLTGGAGLPSALDWLPQSDATASAASALGIGALLALSLVAGGFRPSLRLVAPTALVWVGVALLQGGAIASTSTEWLLWGMLGLALSVNLIVRWIRPGAASRASTILLTLFALLWMGLWAAAIVTPALRLPGLSPLAVATTVKLFWLPWLLLPAALLPHTTHVH